jgi:trigger factor
MTTELTNVSDCQKEVTVEVPAAKVDEAIDELSRRYSRKAKVPGFRPGKVPVSLIRTRFREEILKDAAEQLVPQAVDDALNEHQIDPIAPPEIRNVNIDEGKPLTFTATFETIPPVDPGNYDAFVLRRPSVAIDDEAVTKALQRLRENASVAEPVEERVAAVGDILTVDLERHLQHKPGEQTADNSAPERHVNVTVELGNRENPPGFDEHLTGINTGTQHEFTLELPNDFKPANLAGSKVTYSVDVKSIHKRILPNLDDEFAKDVGDFNNLNELKEHLKRDLEQQAKDNATREVRGDLLRQLASRLTCEVPATLVTNEVELRIESLVRQMIAQQVDPRRANIDWDAFREQQRDSAIEAVRSSLVLDAIAQRESVNITDTDINQEYARQSELSGRSVSAVRASVEKENKTNRLIDGLRRQRAIDLLMTRATIVKA